MPSKNTTRKNTKQVEKPKAETTKVDDDWSTNITVKSTTNTTRKKKVKEPEPVPPPAPTPDWEKLGMTEQDYKAMLERVAKQMMEWQIENYKAALDADLDSISYWESRLDWLEQSRERYNKKRGWSAEDIYAVEEIDDQIKECEENIDRIESWDVYEEGVAAY